MTGRQDRGGTGAAQPARRVLVVGGSPARPAPELLTRLVADADAVVACDSGADACRAAGVRLSALIGDNDSLDPLSLRYARDQGACERGFSPDKDQADLGLALQYVRQAYPHVEESRSPACSAGVPTTSSPCSARLRARLTCARSSRRTRHVRAC